MPLLARPSKKKALLIGNSLPEMTLMTSDATMPPTIAHTGASSMPDALARSCRRDRAEGVRAWGVCARVRRTVACVAQGACVCARERRRRRARAYGEVGVRELFRGGRVARGVLEAAGALPQHRRKQIERL